MSDISIRFDGLALLVTLVLSALGYCLVAVVALTRHRPQIARHAALMGVATIVITGAFFAYWAKQGTNAGLENVDALILPWGAIFLASCWQLARTGRK